jgi:hypothetical protein
MNKNTLKLGGVAALITGAAVAGMLTFGGTVSAQTPAPTAQPGAPAANTPKPAGPRHVAAAAVAKALGMDEAALRTALQGGKTVADLAKEKGVAVSAITDAVLAAEKENLSTAITDGTFLKGGPGGHGGRGGKGDRGGPMGARVDFLGIAATTLGMDQTALRTELQSGKTLTQIAQAKNIDPAKITAAWLAAEQTALDAAVKAGTITQAQADQHLAIAKTRMADMLTRVPGAGRGLRGGQQGGAIPGGFAPDAPDAAPQI